jgi:hypothetical protein
MTSSGLSVAVRVAGPLPAAWVVASVRLLAAAPHVDLVLVLADERFAVAPHVISRDHRRSTRLAWRLAACVDRLVRLGSSLHMPDPLAPAPLEGIPRECRIVAVREGDGTVADMVARAVADAVPDVVVDYAPPEAPALDLGTPLRLGVWSYLFDGPGAVSMDGVAVLETLGPTTLTSFAIAVDQGAGALPLRTGAATAFTDSHSFTQNRAQALWSAAPLVAQEVARAARSGAVGGAADPGTATTPLPVLAPGGLGLMAAATRYSARVVAESVRRALCREEWILLADRSTKPPHSQKGPDRRLDPGPDRYWADPWVVEHDGHGYVFAEELPYATGRGRIVVLDPDDRAPLPSRTVILEEPWHLSYPCVFRWRDDYYMLPECAASGRLHLYRCREFPARWQHERTILPGVRGFDGTVLEHDGRWWLFVAVAHFPWTVSAHELHVFFADDPVNGEWTPHPGNPVCRDARRSRPGGACFHLDGRLVRVGQDGSRGYGSGLRFVEVLTLTETDYEEREIAVVQPHWLKGMLGTHTLSLTGGYRLVDGRFRVLRFRPPRRRPQRPAAE